MLIKAVKKYDIKVVEIQLLETNLAMVQEDLSYESFTYGLELEHMTNPEEKLISNQCKVSIVCEDVEVGGITVNGVFKVSNVDFEYDKNGIKNFPKDLATTLNDFIISTTRGIMSSEFRGTHLHHAYFPFIDPNNFSRENPQ